MEVRESSLEEIRAIFRNVFSVRHRRIDSSGIVQRRLNVTTLDQSEQLRQYGRLILESYEALLFNITSEAKGASNVPLL